MAGLWMVRHLLPITACISVVHVIERLLQVQCGLWVSCSG